jgi:hypothetical protein
VCVQVFACVLRMAATCICKEGNKLKKMQTYLRKPCYPVFTRTMWMLVHIHAYFLPKQVSATSFIIVMN